MLSLDRLALEDKYLILNVQKHIHEHFSMVCVWVVKETQLLAPITMTTIIYQNYRKQVDFLDHVLGIGQICSGKESENFK